MPNLLKLLIAQQKKKVYKFQNRLTEIISEPCLIKREVEKWWYFKVEKEISKERKSNYTHESKITYFPLLEKHQSTILMPQKKKNYSLFEYNPNDDLVTGMLKILG